MKTAMRKALVAGVIMLIAASAAAPAYAFAGCRHHYHRALSYYGWPDRFARVSSYWLPQGYGCGPFADNEDGWDIGWAGRCYFPSGY